MAKATKAIVSSGEQDTVAMMTWTARPGHSHSTSLSSSLKSHFMKAINFTAASHIRKRHFMHITAPGDTTVTVTASRVKARLSSSTWWSGLLTCNLLLLLLSHCCIPHCHIVVVASISGIWIFPTSNWCSRLLRTSASR